MDTDHILIYVILIVIISYLIYQLNSVDYSRPIEYFRSSLPPEVIITINNFQFSPDYIIIPVNTTVKWINLDQGLDRNYGSKPRQHALTDSNGNLFSSGDLPLNGHYMVTFTRPGTYYYHDLYHPEMKGSIMVIPNPEI